jgi:OOP family OmpA-OmpF porin
MNAMKKIALVMLITTLYVAPVFADNTGNAYIAVDVGQAKFVPTLVYSDPGMVRIAGGYNFNANFAIEVGYTKFNEVSTKVTGGSITIASSSFQAAGAFSYPISTDIDLTAKLGVSSNHMNATSSGSVVLSNPNLTNSSILYGVGAQYHINPKVRVRIQYEDFGDFNDVSPSVNLTAFSIGIVYLF